MMSSSLDYQACACVFLVYEHIIITEELLDTIKSLDTILDYNSKNVSRSYIF